MSAFDWQCPFCGKHTTITDQSVHIDHMWLLIDNCEGKRGLLIRFVVCPNPGCKQFALDVVLTEATYLPNINRYEHGAKLKTWQLIPASKAQSFPSYIPNAILDDYNEACLIVNLSPKASATLSRRCLQGILRDYWQVKAGRLVDEIEQLKTKIDPLTWSAIESVRKVGNIGAHMEKEINLIVDVEPHEAELLIGLIETLLNDWYIARHEREVRLQKIIQLAPKKDAAKKGDDKGLCKK